MFCKVLNCIGKIVFHDLLHIFCTVKSALSSQRFIRQFFYDIYSQKDNAGLRTVAVTLPKIWPKCLPVAIVSFNGWLHRKIGQVTSFREFRFGDQNCILNCKSDGGDLKSKHFKVRIIFCEIEVPISQLLIFSRSIFSDEPIADTPHSVYEDFY